METTQPKKKRSLLPLWILIGMFAGILVGLLCLWLPNWFNHPEWKEPMVNFTTNWLKPIGDIYINLLKFLIVPASSPPSAPPASPVQARSCLQWCLHRSAFRSRASR